MTALEERQATVELLKEATGAGARQDQACAVLGVSARTLQRWQDGEAVPSARCGHTSRPTS